uniref:EF-hand domain-containing protein n=1 Tax=Guillardia theta TaxID=55529 RepID=A0A7S4NSY3_GUITH|mmetsp:Transcript_31128/g.99897  ORF Transcript_31128/g.99897 Transcript_31128/m.99897 type:complete len:1049 (+) Transcript_31128:158-3304(+)
MEAEEAEGTTNDALHALQSDPHADLELSCFSFHVPGLNLLAAALLYNGLTPEEGFEVFDIDCDGKINLSEFLQTSRPLLGMIDEAAHVQLHRAMDFDGSGCIERHNWIELLRGYDAAKVLEERGITPCVHEQEMAEEEERQLVERGAEIPPPLPAAAQIHSQDMRAAEMVLEECEDSGISAGGGIDEQRHANSEGDVKARYLGDHADYLRIQEEDVKAEEESEKESTEELCAPTRSILDLQQYRQSMSENREALGPNSNASDSLKDLCLHAEGLKIVEESAEEVLLDNLHMSQDDNRAVELRGEGQDVPKKASKRKSVVSRKPLKASNSVEEGQDKVKGKTRGTESDAPHAERRINTPRGLFARLSEPKESPVKSKRLLRSRTPRYVSEGLDRSLLQDHGTSTDLPQQGLSSSTRPSAHESAPSSSFETPFWIRLSAPVVPKVSKEAWDILPSRKSKSRKKRAEKAESSSRAGLEVLPMIGNGVTAGSQSLSKQKKVEESSAKAPSRPPRALLTTRSLSAPSSSEHTARATVSARGSSRLSAEDDAADPVKVPGTSSTEKGLLSLPVGVRPGVKLEQLAETGRSRANGASRARADKTSSSSGWSITTGDPLTCVQLLEQVNTELGNPKGVESIWRPSWCQEGAKPTFFVVNGNGFPSIVDTFTKHGYQRLSFNAKNDDSYAIRWVQQTWEVNFDTFRAGEQLVNVLPGVEVLSNKSKLLRCLEEHAKSSGCDLGFLPMSKIASNPRGLLQGAGDLLGKEGEEMARDERIWIIKPSNNNQGTGIVVCRTCDIPAISRDIWVDSLDVIEPLRAAEEGRAERRSAAKKERGKKSASGEKRLLRPGDEVILQEYIMNPLLIARRKFDIRAFCLVASVNPRLFLRYDDFYLRRACEAFDVKDLGRKSSHLTNICVQKHHPLFGEDSVWDASRFRQYLESKDLGGMLDDQILPGIERIMTDCVQAALPTLSTRRGCFQLLGFDLLIDVSGHVYLLEVNRNPDLQSHTRRLHGIFHALLEDTLQVVTDVNIKLMKGMPPWPPERATSFKRLMVKE